MKICQLFTNQYYSSFDNDFYKQKFRLQLGLAHSGNLACLFILVVEVGTFQSIFPKQLTYSKYNDNAVLLYPRKTTLADVVDKLNKVERTIYPFDHAPTIAHIHTY